VIGCLAAVVRREGARLPARVGWIAVVAVLGAMIGVAGTVQSEVFGSPLVALCCGAVVVAAVEPGLLGRVLSMRCLTPVGRVAYQPLSVAGACALAHGLESQGVRAAAFDPLRYRVLQVRRNPIPAASIIRASAPNSCTSGRAAGRATLSSKRDEDEPQLSSADISAAYAEPRLLADAQPETAEHREALCRGLIVRIGRRGLVWSVADAEPVED
jgi:hypothetical protein